MRIKASFLIIALLLSSLANAPRPQRAPPLIHLHRGTIDATQANPLTPASPLLAAAPGPYAILQLRGPITSADRAALENTGVQLLEYLPDFAYLVRGTPKQLDSAAQLPQVYARASFTLADKLAPSILRALRQGENGVGPVQIIGWPNDHGALARDLTGLAIAPQPVALNAAQVLQVANLETVRWIEPASQPRLLNDHARAIMHVDSVWQNQNLFGAGQIIAVADSGLDTGVMETMSPDFAGRITATHVLSPTGDWGDGHGHGTHVTGSIAGAGVQSGAITATHTYTGSFAGVAPEASLVIQAFEVSADGSSLFGLPDDYYSLFDQAYTDGARLHSDSWGFYTGPLTTTATTATFGGYTYGSQRTDEFMWDHPDMAIFFAAGNSGMDGALVSGYCASPETPDGVIDSDSLLAPATAKNVVTVGAAEGDRSTGDFGGYYWAYLNPYCFSHSPIAGDFVANNPEGMAAFSSRGPTDDGRIKPDIVAPGTNIVSNHSHYSGAGVLWGLYETNSDYAYDGGTSMATPLTAGAGALVREWLVNQGLANPSAAALKATLLNTTHDMAPGQYGTGATQEIPYSRPNNVAGWGRVDLGFIEEPTPYTLWVDDHTAGLTTGQVITYTDTLTRPLQVTDSSQPLRIMLAWTDPPASLSASTQLVNDLDLVVIGPGNTTYYGNDVTTGDRLNNVEGIIINNPPLGEYQVQVTAYNVPSVPIDSQPFALVVAGPLLGGGEPPTATPTKTNTPVPPTNTPTRTNTPLPPTNTPTLTNTPLIPPTNTPTRTNTPVPPTNTPTRTNTPINPPTNTPTRTNTPVPLNYIYLPLVRR